MEISPPAHLASYVASIPSAQLTQLRDNLYEQFGGGFTADAICDAMVKIGWPEDFSRWYVGLVKTHGTAFTIATYFRPNYGTYSAPPIQQQRSQPPQHGGAFQSGEPGQAGNASPFSQPPIYARTGYRPPKPQNDVNLAYVMAALGCVCCPLTAIAGVVLAARALKAGNSAALAALVVNIVALVAGAILVMVALGALNGAVTSTESIGQSPSLVFV